jgi:hypothetical protein
VLENGETRQVLVFDATDLKGDDEKRVFKVSVDVGRMGRQMLQSGLRPGAILHVENAMVYAFRPGPPRPSKAGVGTLSTNMSLTPKNGPNATVRMLKTGFNFHEYKDINHLLDEPAQRYGSFVKVFIGIVVCAKTEVELVENQTAHVLYIMNPSRGGRCERQAVRLCSLYGFNHFKTEEAVGRCVEVVNSVHQAPGEVGAARGFRVNFINESSGLTVKEWAEEARRWWASEKVKDEVLARIGAEGEGDDGEEAEADMPGGFSVVEGCNSDGSFDG